MKPGRIATAISEGNRAVLRVVKPTEDPTVKMELPEWHARKRQSAAGSGWVVLCLVAICGGGLGVLAVIAWWRAHGG